MGVVSGVFRVEIWIWEGDWPAIACIYQEFCPF